ncbi:hypothetical protein HDE_05681 [Halotydeus destructor]|nr:hypothetical protein HDE_05681 [Halotydeus destructor]
MTIKQTFTTLFTNLGMGMVAVANIAQGLAFLILFGAIVEKMAGTEDDQMHIFKPVTESRLRMLFQHVGVVLVAYKAGQLINSSFLETMLAIHDKTTARMVKRLAKEVVNKASKILVGGGAIYLSYSQYLHRFYADFYVDCQQIKPDSPVVGLLAGIAAGLALVGAAYKVGGVANSALWSTTNLIARVVRTPVPQ